MEKQLENLLESFLADYPAAEGAAFHSMELNIVKTVGAHAQVLEKYKDIPMMSIDESFTTAFNFIITEKGTIIIFFIQDLHFISVFVKGSDPNKELAIKMYDQFKTEFESVIENLYEAQ